MASLSLPRQRFNWQTEPMQYGLVLVAVMAAALLRSALEPVLENRYPFVTFLVPVLLAAALANWKPATFALLLGYIAANYFFIAPRSSLHSGAQFMGALSYVGIGLLNIFLFETVRAAKCRAASQLEDHLRKSAAEGSRVAGQLCALTTETRVAEEKCRRMRALIASSDDAIVGLDLDNLVTDWNPGAERLFGIPAADIVGRSIFTLVPEAAHEQARHTLQRILDGEQVEPYEAIRLRREKGEVTVSVRLSAMKNDDGRITGFALIYRDLTHAKKLEEQVWQAQKLEAIGTLAGGVAHDFNNLLTVINGYSELILHSIRPEDPMHALVAEIKRAGERSAALTRQLLAFSRKQVVVPCALNLNAVVTDMQKMLARIIGEDIALVTVLAPDLGVVEADPGQVEQVLVNLAVNSRDAMERGGKLTIETENVTLDPGYTAAHVNVRPGRYVRLAVSDTGCGMSAEVRSHIYEPFFTTKATGKGTGLGLSVVHGIVKQSGGHIEVYSEPGLGTTFKVYFPRTDPQAPFASVSNEPAELPRGSETVLLVEDDAVVRGLGARILRECGYRVLEAADAEEAVRIASKFGEPISLLLTDVVMPGTGGRQLAERLAPVRPEMQILYLSGYTDDAVVRHGILHDEVNFLQKPFSPAALAHKVREILDPCRSLTSR